MTAEPASPRAAADLVYLGFNRRVLALDRYSGQLVWEWKAPKGSGFVTLLLDGDRLIVSVSGYTYCLDPVYGQLVWENPLEGYGMGLASLCSLNGTSANVAAVAAAVAAQQAARRAAAGS